MEQVMDRHSLKEISALLQCEGEGKVSGFSFDSRLVKRGDLFFALKGATFDGHQFLKEIAAKGAAAAVVEKSYNGPGFGLQLFRVGDVVCALQTLAAQVQKSRPARVVAITGSVGKTTTKEFLSHLIGKKFKVAKTPGNANSQVGFPLAILNSEGGEEILVAEMGMSEEGNIKKLVEIAPPEIAVVTFVGRAHVASFPDGLEGVARAKAEIFSHPQTKFAVLNVQSLRFSAMQSVPCPKATFGEGGDYRLHPGWFIEEKGVESPRFQLPFTETHLLEDFLAAIAAARRLGLSWDELIIEARTLKGEGLRFEKVERDGILFINDCYNANPESMQAALSNLPKPRLGCKTVAVLGEMAADLGKQSEQWYREVAQTALSRVDHVLCYGKGCLAMMECFVKAKLPAEYFKDLDSLRKELRDIAKPGDVVLIKGKNTSKMWQILETK